MTVPLLADVWTGIGGDGTPGDLVTVQGSVDGLLPSSVAVGPLAVAAHAAVGLAAREWAGTSGPVTVSASGAATAVRSEQAVRIDGAPPGPVWDPLSRVYRTADGWVRLHANYAQHRAAIDRVFGSLEPGAVEAAIRQAEAEAVEAALHRAGGVAAAARTEAAWASHPHGATVRDRPLVETVVREDRAGPREELAGRPLRVLELTRVIAGPVAGRTLSWFGADVLRLESPGHEELPVIVADFGVGKRSATVDLRTAEGRRVFLDLVAGADVFLHGLRPGALERLGIGAEARAAVRPGLIDVSLSAYGTTGAWGGRRGFDSLLQLSSGLAVSEALAAGGEPGPGGLPEPRALPCQILDHATGLLLAAATLRAARARAGDGRGRTVIGSLARTAAFLSDQPRALLDASVVASPVEPGSLTLRGALGRTAHAPLPVVVEGAGGGWGAPPPMPGADAAAWGARAG